MNTTFRDRLWERIWNVYGRWYIRLADLYPYQELTNAVCVEVAKAGDGPLLDAGCGPGYLLGRLRSQHPEWKIQGIDRSPVMQKTAQRNLGSGIEVLCADMDAGLPYADSAFRVITCTNVLYAVPNPRKLLEEFHRLLAPGGVLVIVNPWQPNQGWIWGTHIKNLYTHRDIRGMFRMLRFAHQYIFFIGINALIAQRAKGQTFHFWEPKKLQNEIEKAGFVVQMVQEKIYADTCCLVSAETR